MKAMMVRRSIWVPVAVIGWLAGGGCGGTQDPQTSAANGGEDTVSMVSGALTVPTTSSEYKLPAVVDPDVLAIRATELWARVYRPATLAAGVRYPLLVFLHGNHGTCGTGSNPRADYSIEYTYSGTCPSGWVVTPNHEGYAYVAEQLASQGYIVVSINANRGITGPNDWGEDDWSLNLARGRLVLKHLATLAAWDRGAAPTPASLGVDLRDHIDFNQVGLMGHSRGGEGMRAAYNFYLEAESAWPARIVTPVQFRGIFEIGPVDNQSGRSFDAPSTRRAVLLPMCDGDVSDLEGVRSFDRMMGNLDELAPSFKSTLTAWGTNHNYFNSEWQISDSGGCIDHAPIFAFGAGVVGSPAQRDVGRILMSSFFLGSVGAQRDPAQNALFDPMLAEPSALTAITRVDRGFALSPDKDVALRLEEFIGEAGTSTFGQPNVASGVNVEHTTMWEHDFTMRAGRVAWATPGSGIYYQTNFTPVGSGISLSRYGTLDLRVERADDPANPAGPTDFSVRLVNAQNALSAPQRIASFVDLRGPVGGPGGRHSMLQTARIPLSGFTGVTLASVRGVRFTFDQTASGAIWLANVRATRTTCAATPKLDLKVRQIRRSANDIHFRVQVYNRDTAPVRLADLGIKLWLSDPAPSLVAQVYYGGQVVNAGGVYQFGGITATAGAARVQPSCAPAPDRVADWTASAAVTDARSIPAGGAWVDMEIGVHRADWSAFASLGDDFSQTPSYQGGNVSDAVWPAVYGDDSHFVAYYRGTPAGEYVAGPGPDPAGGLEPSCVAACVAPITSPMALDPGPPPVGSLVARPAAAAPAPAVVFTPTRVVTQNQVVRLGPSTAAWLPAGSVDLEALSGTPFPILDQEVVLRAGDVQVLISRYPDPNDLHRIAFTFTAEQFATLKGGEPLSIHYGRFATSGTEWQLGKLDLGLFGK